MKVTSLSSAPVRPMKRDKGTARDLVGLPDGARNVDVHLNMLKSDAPVAPYHFHKHADNVYIVLEGIAEAVIDGQRRRLGPNDVVYIPPGVPHAVGGAGEGPVTLIEIYAPAGEDFHIVTGGDS